MIAGAYLRKSNDEPGKDEADKSCVRQLQRCREFAKARGWQFEDKYVFSDDGISGGEWLKRAGLNKLLDTIKDGSPFQVLVVSELSRIGRDVIRTMATLQTLEDCGIQVWSYLDEKRLTVEGSGAKITTFVEGWSGEEEKSKASQRVRDKMRQKVERGEIVTRLPYGYLYENNTAQIVEAEASIIRRVFTRRAAGAGYHVICRELERDKVLSPRGLTTWCQSQIAGITRNSLYHGVQTWGQTQQVRKRGSIKTAKADASNIVMSLMPKLRIVPEDLWKAVQDVNERANAACMRRAKDGTLLSRPSVNPHMLAGFIACGVCGGSMYIRAGRTGGVKGPHFFCTTRHLKGAAKCSNARTLKYAHAEHALMYAFEEALVAQAVLDVLNDCLDEVRRTQVDPGPLKSEMAGIKVEIGNLVKLAAAGGEVEEITDAIATRKRRIDEIENMLVGANAVATVDVDDVRERIESVLCDWRTHLRKHPSTARAVLHKVLPERVKATPTPGGGWRFSGVTDYQAVLKEAGFAAVAQVLEKALPKLSRKAGCRRWCSRRG